ncbi:MULTISPECIES: SRPBCC family protein [Rhodococcus]|uniref:SRPBCC family protein n=1 Tax=Rhodococcus TaxID=1827 RepID=UPI00081AA4CE|nr:MULTISPECIES: SRPBCC family protein [Rhodococcus]ANZ27691.1 carbon monoxide dehydrogenase [Rhodococcus sp. WB1]QRI77034.1 SRPBCC family protein [Rhodococcus aetherivorans]QSE60454.1 SRPBCC family protein [Rhodococcus sp. PSBB066]QSE68240.1 SRPBCC family protein [Rhodococcus sp. PSBB049]
MQLEHHMSVPAPIDEVWTALLDPEKVAPCMPGATLTGVDGNTFTGTVKIKMGPVQLLYKGTGEFVETDEQARRAVMEAAAKDSRGNGTVNATFTITLVGDGDRTEGTVVTDLSITGKPAQFGRGMISDVGGKIIEQFTACLADKLGGPPAPVPMPEAAAPPPPAGGAPEVTPAVPVTAAPQPTEAAPLDLMQYARGSVLKRVGPAVAVSALVALIVYLLLRRRHP